MIPGLETVGENEGVLMFLVPSDRPGVHPYELCWGYEKGWLECSCLGFVGHRMTATVEGGGCKHCQRFASGLRGGSNG